MDSERHHAKHWPPHIFWGWYMVMGAFLILSTTYGSRYSFGVFLKPMSVDYGWSRAVISLGASINMLVYSTCCIFVGRMLDKVAPRWIITTGTVITAVSLFLTPHVNTPLQFYIVYGLLCGIGTSCMGVVVINSSIGKWFSRKRGLAIGIATMGVSFGSIAFTSVSGYIVKYYSWQTGFIFLGILVFVIGTPVSQWIMRRTNPETYGLLPDGDSASDYSTNAHEVNNASVQLPLKIMLKDSRFWVLAFSYGLAVMTLMSIFVHQVAYAMDNHIDEFAAAASLGTVGIGGFFGQFFFGWLSDRLKDVKYAAFLGMVIMAAGMILLLNAMTIQLLYVYALVYGFGYGSTAPMIPILVADRFGRHVMGSVYGILTFFIGIGGGIGPFLGGLIYDHFGSYTYVWKTNFVILAVCAILILVLKPRKDGTRNF